MNIHTYSNLSRRMYQFSTKKEKGKIKSAILFQTLSLSIPSNNPKDLMNPFCNISTLTLKISAKTRISCLKCDAIKN